jgi:uncharacterized protein (TIGR04255 family)
MAQPEARKLEAPPIIEVVCGVFFAPRPELDPIFVGGWHNEVAHTELPRHAIQPAVADGTGFFMGVGPLRSWLISQDDEWVVQIQPDRLYVNWRRREGEYPRFSDRGGVLERALFELRRFRAHCVQKLGADLALTGVELAKVDVIAQGLHWSDTADLGKVIPLVADVSRFASSSNVELALNIVDRPNTVTQVVVGLSLATESVPKVGLARAVKIDTRCTARLAVADDTEITECFTQLNMRANDTFFSLISPNELGRFDRKG